MTTAVRFLAALAVLAFATPALPCSDHEKTVTAAAEKAPAAKVAKSGATAKKATKASKPAAEAKPVTAAN
ncbi:MAG TPA: hypothetical protein VIW03_09580 [Anaeromyxobacter sp.]